MMKVWTNNTFEGHWPVGTAAVVVAESAEAAADLLTEAVRGIARQTVLASDMKELDTSAPAVTILRDGDY